MKKHLPVKLSVFFLCCLFAAASLQAQNIITTVAGGGTNYANGVLATTAALTQPSGIDVDAAGNLYIAVTAQNKVRKVNPAGYIYTIAGTGLNSWGGDSGQAVSAFLNHPYGVVHDNAGNLYINDLWNNRTRKITTGGIIYNFAGNGLETYNGDGGLADTTSTGYNSGVEIDASGKIYITDTWHNLVRVVNSSGYINAIAGTGWQDCTGDGGPALSATFTGAMNCAIDASGNVYVVDFNCNTVRKIDASGTITAFAGNGSVDGFSGDGGPATSAQLALPNDVTVDNAGNVYICDQGNHRIRKVDPSGIITTVAGNGIGAFGGDGGAAVSAQLASPDGITTDNAGNLYIADQVNNRIRKVTMGACNAYFYIYPDTGVSGLYYGRNLATGSNLTYLWSFGDGATSTQQYPSHTYASSGQYYVCLTINNGAGCVTTYCDSSYLVFKTDDGLMNQLTILAPGSVGVEEVKSNKFDFVLSPNPSSESVAITIPETLIGSTATITDITGRKMAAVLLITYNLQLTTSNFPDGIYFVTVSNGSQSATRKLVVSK